MTPRDITLPCTLRPRRVRTILFLLVCLGFALIGGLMIRDGDGRGYFVGGLFALGVPVFALQLHPRAAYLRLDESGFTFCSLFRAQTVRWADVADFGVINVGAGRLVAWNFVPGHPRTGHGRAISQAIGGYEAALPDTYGLKPLVLAVWLNTLCQRWRQPPTNGPFFSEVEVARLIGGQPIGEPLPFDPTDDGSMHLFYAGLVQRIERENHLSSRVEWHHYGSGYASFVEAWFYPADSRARLPAFQVGGERHVGLTVLLSRLSRYFVLGQDEKAWSAVGGSGGLPNFSTVDDVTHPTILALAAPVTALLTARGLQRLSRLELAALLPRDTQVPTILTDEAFRQFDALFYWED